MKVLKYVKKGNGNYQVLLDNDKKINLSEDVILKYNLLYKKEIDENLFSEIILENNKYDIYNKCVKYISVRLRSVKEIRDYMERKCIEKDVIENTIRRLLDNKLLDDDVFTKAFVSDKLNFTTMGPYRIELELKKHNIDNEIIYKYISMIDRDKLVSKIDKQINKLMKSNKNKINLKNKIYNNLLSLGYPGNLIISELNKYF